MSTCYLPSLTTNQDLALESHNFVIYYYNSTMKLSIAVLAIAASAQAFTSISTPAATRSVSTNKIAGDAFAPVSIRST
jgi:hypothetical protein